MNKKVIIIVIVLILIIIFGFLVSKTGNNKIVSPQVFSQNTVVPTLIPTPTPTPIVFDENSNLEEEVEKLTPEDFSGDFKTLKQEVAN